MEPFVTQQDVHHQPTEEELDEAEVNALGPNSVVYKEAPASEFENTFTWAGVVVARCHFQR